MSRANPDKQVIRNSKRYERQGLLVEDEALERAEKECAAADNARKLARARAAARRAELDLQYIRSFAGRVREIYRFCPPERERLIAVTAHVRHAETNN